jgi:hypothetical protein
MLGARDCILDCLLIVLCNGLSVQQHSSQQDLWGIVDNGMLGLFSPCQTLDDTFACLLISLIIVIWTKRYISLSLMMTFQMYEGTIVYREKVLVSREARKVAGCCCRMLLQHYVPRKYPNFDLKDAFGTEYMKSAL